MKGNLIMLAILILGYVGAIIMLLKSIRNQKLAEDMLKRAMNLTYNEGRKEIKNG
jgi:Tfp pilus assembly protein PilO